MLLTGYGVVHHPTLLWGCILRQLQQVVEVEERMRPRPLERLDVVAEPTFVAYFQNMGPTHMGQNVTPVVVVLDEIALGKADTEAGRQSGDGDRGNRKVAGLADEPVALFDVLDHEVQRRGIKGVSPVHLEGAFHRVIRGRELRNNRRTAIMENRPVKTAVDAVVFEVLVDAREILVAVAEISRVGNSSIQHRERAGDVFYG